VTTAQLTYQHPPKLNSLGASRYTWDGALVPGVTAVLGHSLVDYSAPWFTDKAKEWGSNLHECCALVDHGTIDWDSVDGRIEPEVRAYARWKEKTGFQPFLIETPMYSLMYQFGGRFDVLGLLNGELAVVDRKRGIAHPSTGLQLAAYTQLISENLEVARWRISRWALTGFNNGEPKMIEYTERSDWDVFLGQLNGMRWAEKHGVKPRGMR